VLVHSHAERLLYYNLKKLSGYEDRSIPNIKVSTVTRRDNVTYSIVKYKISSGALRVRGVRRLCFYKSADMG
jgi:hypothetical protein